MRPSLTKRLWESSPGSLCRALKRRIDGRKEKSGWFRIQGGPLAGLDFFLPNDRGAWARMIDGTFDDFIYQELGKNLSGKTCWDVGAHFGYHSMGFASLGANVLAFEPNSTNAARLKENLDRHPALASRIRHISDALSNEDGETIFVQSNDLRGHSSGSHLAVTDSSGEVHSGFERLKIKTVRIDTLVARGEKPPDILKIDVEGAEYLVIEGGHDFFFQHNPSIFMEVHHICLMFRVEKFLIEAGYKLKLLDEAGASGSRCFLMATKS
jgi:FkbM family methyltransferase